MIEVNFGVVDYLVFILSLVFALAIGAYFTFCGKNKKTTDEYFYGSKKMQAIPVGLSLYSSAIASLAVIGIPTEIYTFGTDYIMISIGIIISLLLSWVLLLPIFCGNLNIKTPYEYFERRFDNKVKFLSLFIYILDSMLLMPVLLYVPSLAFSHVTQINVFVCTITVGGICIIYTTFGGFQTVIWSDSFQATLMLFSCLWVAISGVQKAGGFLQVWENANEGNRISLFNMNPNPFIRTTFWSASLGFIFLHFGHSGVSAPALQRYMSLPNENHAKVSTTIGAVSTIIVVIIMAVTGLAMYTIYKTCDPVMNKELSNPNQLLLYFITQTLDYVPGFCGFFIAGLLSASLSTISSDLNNVSGIIYYDFLYKFCKNKKFIKNREFFTIKTIVVLVGIVYLLLIPLIQQSNHVLQFTIALTSTTYGAKIGLMLLGILFPKSNSKGAIIGSLTSIVVIGWINYGAKINNINSYYTLQTSIENCTTANLNTTSISSSSYTGKMDLDNIFILYRISYLYYSLFGTLITVIIGNIVSYFTGANNIHDIDPILITPFLRKYINRNKQTELKMVTQP